MVPQRQAIQLSQKLEKTNQYGLISCSSLMKFTSTKAMTFRNFLSNLAL